MEGGYWRKKKIYEADLLQSVDGSVGLGETLLAPPVECRVALRLGRLVVESLRFRQVSSRRPRRSSTYPPST